MALTRKMLKAMSIDDEKIDQIIEAHTETLEAIKAERDALKERGGDVEAIRKERDELKKAIEDGNKESYKVKYEAIKEDFEKFKSDISAKETKVAKENAYRALLKSCGISEKRIDAVMRVSDIKSIELDEAGKITNAKELSKSIKEEWSDFIAVEGVKGANTATPPANNGGVTKLSKAEILNIKDATARQKAIAENPEAFGI